MGAHDRAAIAAEMVEGTFPGQWRLCHVSARRKLAEVATIGLWRLEAGGSNDLLVRVEDADGAYIGLLWGVVIDHRAGKRVTACWRAPISQAADDFVEVLERHLYAFSGSWVFILVTEVAQRLYLDAGGSMSAVYAMDRSQAASTTGLMLDAVEYRQRFDAQLYERLGVSAGGWFPAGLTAHHGVRRLLANHFLDLERFTDHRHWMLEPDEEYSDVEPVLERLASVLTGVSAALTGEGRVLLPMTGGLDCRVLLAACRQNLENVDLMTVWYPGADRDVHLAKAISRVDRRIRHRVLKPRRVDVDEARQWAFRVSHCVGGANQTFRYSREDMLPYRYFLSGVGGEVGRAFLWNGAEEGDTPISSRSLIGRLGLRPSPVLEEAVEGWLAGVSASDRARVLDLAYLELRVSAWAYVQSYAHVAVGHMCTVSPMVNRDVFQCFAALDRAQRLSGAPFRAVIQRLWPELLSVPINRYGDLRDWFAPARKLLQPVRVARKARKVLVGR